RSPENLRQDTLQNRDLQEGPWQSQRQSSFVTVPQLLPERCKPRTDLFDCSLDTGIVMRNSMITAACILLFLGGDLIKPPSVVPTDRGSVIVSGKGGDRRWTANWTMEPLERDGKKAIRFTERGQGTVSPYSEEVKWSLESLWSAENSLRPLESEK